MTVTASALADLRFSLKFAAGRYRQFFRAPDGGSQAVLVAEIASERLDDEKRLMRAAQIEGLQEVDPTLSADTAGSFLGLGRGFPSSLDTALQRIGRSENTLRRMVAQLQSLSNPGAIRKALTIIGRNIENRRDELRIALGVEAQSYAAGTITPQVEDTEGHLVDVWFGTNRARDNFGRYLSKRDIVTSFGYCSVFVPRKRPLGSLGRNFFGRLFKGDDRVKIRSTRPLKEMEFWQKLTEICSKLDNTERQGLIFLHGYNTSFKDAARRTAQLKVDLAHKGPAAFFSWPSLSMIRGYTCDESAIQGSELALRDFLIDFANRSGASNVHIIAHSMGNRGLLRALDSIANTAALASRVQFGQIIIAAPDVDSQLFANLAHAYSRLAQRATLYVSANDRAIGLSRRLHGYAYAGLTPPVMIVPGVDTIDASDVNIGFLGHSYAMEIRSLLNDIHALLKKNVPPDDRFGLRRVASSGAIYWEFQG